MSFIEDVKVLLPVDIAMFRLILFSNFRETVENIQANNGQGQPYRFSYRPEKPNLGIGHCFLLTFVKFC